MSRLRPTLRTNNQTGKFCPRNGTAYLMVLHAVREQPGLIHGELEDHKGHFCAIGSYFEVNPDKCFPTEMVDEVAAVNDSMPHATARQRKVRVMAWLRWKLGQCGFPQYQQQLKPK